MPPRKILKKVVYSRRKIEIIRKNLSPRVDLQAQRTTAFLTIVFYCRCWNYITLVAFIVMAIISNQGMCI